ncbi:hypothetical protein [Steroidobacter cummioxidans]|uniref:hypothetical protein n=1 Tax=Steroidobacter cummioxidans TaxID=1803913 RepID=UPI0013796DE3|nr:hypothetical protein [Steroidobacter cummioxidans]
MTDPMSIVRGIDGRQIGIAGTTHFPSTPRLRVSACPRYDWALREICTDVAA